MMLGLPVVSDWVDNMGSPNAHDSSSQRLDLLTKREKEVLALIAQGLSVSQISQKLHRSQKTVESHRLALGRKLQVTNRVELARIAIQAGLAPLEPGFEGTPERLNKQLRDEIAKRQRAQAALQAIEIGTAQATGKDFFRRLVRYLASALEVDYAFVSEFDEPQQQMRHIAGWSRGGHDDNITTAFPDSPWETTITQSRFACAKDLRKLFPSHAMIHELQADCFLGMTLQDAAGRPLGTLAVLHTKQIATDLEPQMILRIFAARAGAELQRIRADRALHEAHNELERRVEQRTAQLRQTNQALQKEIAQREQAEKALRRRDEILEAVRLSAEWFLTATCWSDAMRRVVRQLGQAADVSRAYLFKNINRDEPPRIARQSFEWAAVGIAPQINNPALHQFNYAQAGFQDWADRLSNGQLVQGVIEDFPTVQRKLLEPQDIQSLIVVPIFVDKSWWGFIGFDDCTQRRTWSSLEVEALKTAGSIIAAAIYRRRVEERLRKSEESHQLAVTAGKVGIWDWNIAERRLKTSSHLKAMLGYDDRELPDTPESWTRLVHPADAPLVQRAFSGQLADENDRFETAFRLLHKDGSARWMLACGRIVRDDKGNVIRITGTDTDITDLKLAGEKLAQSERRYRAVVEDQEELICRFLADGTLTFVNQAYCQYFGKTHEQLVGQSFYDLIPRKEHAALRRYIRSFSPATPAQRVEHCVTTSDGEIRWQSWHDRAFFDDMDRVIEFQSVGRDITDRKLKESSMLDEWKQLEHTAAAYEQAELAEKLRALRAQVVNHLDAGA